MSEIKRQYIGTDCQNVLDFIIVVYFMLRVRQQPFNHQCLPVGQVRLQNFQTSEHSI